MTFIGAIFGLAGEQVHGWLSGAGDEAVTINLLADGRPLASGSLDDAGGGLSLSAGTRTFCIALPATPEPVARIEAYARGRLFAAISFSEQAHAYAGAVETVADGQVLGWAVNLSQPNDPVTLDVYFAGLWVGAVRSEVERADVAARFDVGQPCGFVYNLPPFLRAGAPGVLRFFVANTRIELMGSPAARQDSAPGPEARLAAQLSPN